MSCVYVYIYTYQTLSINSWDMTGSFFLHPSYCLFFRDDVNSTDEHPFGRMFPVAMGGPTIQIAANEHVW